MIQDMAIVVGVQALAEVVLLIPVMIVIGLFSNFEYNTFRSAVLRLAGMVVLCVVVETAGAVVLGAVGVGVGFGIFLSFMLKSFDMDVTPALVMAVMRTGCGLAVVGLMAG